MPSAVYFKKLKKIVSHDLIKIFAQNIGENFVALINNKLPETWLQSISDKVQNSEQMK